MYTEKFKITDGKNIQAILHCTIDEWHIMDSYIHGAQPTGVQQLKAEITALIKWYDVPSGIGGNTVNRTQLLEKLRQLLVV